MDIIYGSLCQSVSMLIADVSYFKWYSLDCFEHFAVGFLFLAWKNAA